MGAAAVAIVGLVAGLFAYSATQENLDGPEGDVVYQRADMASFAAGGTSGDVLASFWVDASSPGATVRIDGDSVGVVPAWVTDVAEGLRRVQVIAPDGSTVADTTLWIEPGAIADLDLTDGRGSWDASPPAGTDAVAATPERALATAATGTMRVTSSPSGATVSVNGRQVGETPISIQGVASGRHRLGIQRSGYESVTRSVDIRGGGTFETAVDLRRAGGTDQASRPAPPQQQPARPAPARPAPPVVATPAIAETGEVEILVRPWGQIVIDGTIHQRESDVLYRTALAPGTHRVVVSHPDLGVQERTVTVTPGGRVRVDVDLSQSGG